MLTTRYPLATTTGPLSTWRGLEALGNRMSHLFDGSFENGSAANEVYWSPAFEVVENSDEVVMYADLPGMRVEDVDIEIENNVLSVTGERRRAEEADGFRRLMTERAFGRFQRVITLPNTVDAASVTAELDNGVLAVRLPKVPQAKGRKIEVRTGA